MSYTLVFAGINLLLQCLILWLIVATLLRLRR